MILLITSPRPAVVLEPLPNGVDGILEHIAAIAAGYLQHRQEGRRFNVRSSYRAFKFA